MVPDSENDSEEVSDAEGTQNVSGKLKTLIVEDDQCVLVLYNKFLPETVFDKKMAANGQEALEMYRRWKPDLMLLDIMLPGITGYSVLKEIRLRNDDTKTPIIMVSSITRKESILDCAQLGIQGYLIKPFNHKQLGDKILEYFSSAQPARAEQLRRNM